MNLQEIVYRVLEKVSGKAQSAQAAASWGESTPVSFEADKLKSIKTSQTILIGLKVIADGRVGESHVTDPEDVDLLVEKALSLAKFGREVGYTFPKEKAPDVKLYDEAVAEIPTERLVDQCREMLGLVKAYNPDITVYAYAAKQLVRTHVANTTGLDFEGEGTGYSLRVYGELVQEGDILMAGYGRGWRRAEIDPSEVARRAVERFRMAERIVQVRSGRMPVLFTPEGLEVLLLSLRLGLSGKNVLLGSSPLSGKLGEEIADPKISLTDSGVEDYRMGSGHYDGDGVPTGRTVLIEEGVLRNFLYDLDTATRAGKKPTGNTGCSPNNWLLVPGDIPNEEMLEGVEEGIVVDDVLGLGQGNPISGEFSVNVALGYKVENGEVVGRVKNTMLAGNVYEALKHVLVVGSRAEWVRGTLCAPPVLVDKLSVVSKA
ncbi:MAG TPA: TldD/PmbA family protein [Candidatus Latescibacteria bacterium]|nr:TldD/PmbA family protein [Candidatus Latescibacterota bacterium]